MHYPFRFLKNDVRKLMKCKQSSDGMIVTNRRRYVEIDDIHSKYQLISTGVVQG